MASRQSRSRPVTEDKSEIMTHKSHDSSMFSNGRDKRYRFNKNEIQTSRRSLQPISFPIKVDKYIKKKPVLPK